MYKRYLVVNFWILQYKPVFFKVFCGIETLFQIFPTVSQDTIEPHRITTPKSTKTSLFDYFGVQMN